MKDFDYSKAAEGIDVQDLEERWQRFQEEYPEYSDESLTTECLDEYQLFFVSLVLDHVEKTLEAWNKNLFERTRAFAFNAFRNCWNWKKHCY